MQLHTLFYTRVPTLFSLLLIDPVLLERHVLGSLSRWWSLPELSLWQLRACPRWCITWHLRNLNSILRILPPLSCRTDTFHTLRPWGGEKGREKYDASLLSETGIPTSIRRARRTLPLYHIWSSVFSPLASTKLSFLSGPLTIILLFLFSHHTFLSVCQLMGNCSVVHQSRIALPVDTCLSNMTLTGQITTSSAP